LKFNTFFLYDQYEGFIDKFKMYCDGDHPTKGPKEAERVKEGQEATKDAKGIQTMVRNLLFQAQKILPSSPENHPVFVHLPKLPWV